MIKDKPHLRGEDVERVGSLGQRLVQDSSDRAIDVIHHVDLATPVLYELLLEVHEKVLGAGLDGLSLRVSQDGVGLGWQVGDRQLLLCQSLRSGSDLTM